jgi:hypothetical protein
MLKQIKKKSLDKLEDLISKFSQDIVNNNILGNITNASNNKIVVNITNSSNNYS